MGICASPDARPHGCKRKLTRGIGQQGQAEVHDGDKLLRARAGHHQVGRLDVAVDDALLVSRLESLGGLDGDIDFSRLLPTSPTSLYKQIQRRRAQREQRAKSRVLRPKGRPKGDRPKGDGATTVPTSIRRNCVSHDFTA